MAYPTAKFNGNGDQSSQYVTPFWIGPYHNWLPNQILPRVSFKYIIINVSRFTGKKKCGPVRTSFKNFLPKRIAGFLETSSKMMYCPLHSRFSKISEESGIIICNLSTFHIHALKEYLHLCSDLHWQNML